MKKVIGIVLAALFLTTGIAAATDFTLSGSYYARGQYHDNVGGLLDDAEAFGVYDHELSVDATWQIDDSTKVFARFEMRDENWGMLGSGSENGNVGGDNDDNIVVERVWGAHTFAATGGTLTVGLMAGGAWATSFFDNGYDAYRIKYVQPTAVGTLIGIIQKSAEGGFATALDDDRTDVDAYMLAMVTKAGPVKIMPLFVFVDHEVLDANAWQFHLAATGTFGAVSFEAEGDYVSYDSDFGAQSDADIFGIYGKVSFNAGPATIGVLGAWGSYDDDEGVAFSYGDDFEAGGAMIIGDDMELVGPDLGAGLLVAATVSFAVTDELTIGGYVGYWTADSDWVNDVYGAGNDDAEAFEISATGSYAITANLTYSLGLGWADLDIDGLDNEDALQAFHKLSFSF